MKLNGETIELDVRCYMKKKQSSKKKVNIIAVK